VPVEIRRSFGTRQSDWLKFDTELCKLVIKKIGGVHVKTIGLVRKLTVDGIDKLIVCRVE